jgi:hypothetical protein
MTWRTFLFGEIGGKRAAHCDIVGPTVQRIDKV